MQRNQSTNIRQARRRPLRPLLGIFVLAFVLSPFQGSCGRRKLGPAELERNRLFAEILKREDRRILGNDDFFPRNLHSSAYPEVREGCAIALGRVGNPGALPWLYRAFHSPYAAVRAAAAFAVGEIEDRAALKAEFRRIDARAVTELVRLLDDPAMQVRMRAVEAIGKIGCASDAEEILRRLQSFRYDESPQQQAYLSLAITALMRLNDPGAFSVLEKLADSADAEIQWRAANALYRMRAKSACATFLKLLQSAHPDVRAHAARGLGLCEDTRLSDALLPLLAPRNPLSGQINPLGVRVHAAQALGNVKNPKAVPVIQKALREAPIEPENPGQASFAIEAARALGNIGVPEGIEVLIPLVRMPGPVANSAIIALAKLLKGDERFFELVPAGQFTDEPAARALAQALGELGGPRAADLLKHLLLRAASEDASRSEVLALPAVLQALAKVRVEDFDTIIEPYLASRDGVILRAAIAAYKPKPETKTPWRPLVQAYERMAEGKDIEAKVAALDSLEPWLSEQEVQTALRSALADRQRNARIAASRLLRKAGAADVPDDPGPAESTATDITYAILADSRQNRTVAVIETERGRIELELFRREAPLTVANFATLARGNFFDGLTFMRVVPYFVVQGGDPRNDMEGGPGYTLRCEINLRPYEKGSVGMALAGKDTGGSQFFITLSPQPHLDGGYTCFGRVISGMQVAERLVPGDRILKAWIEEDATLLDHGRH